MAKVNSCLRGLFIFINILMLVAGCTCIWFVLRQVTSKNNVESADIAHMKTGFIIGGVVTAFLGCLGFYGAKLENKRILKVYFFGVAVCVIALLVIGFLFASQRNQAFNLLKTEFEKHLPLYKKGSEMRDMVEELQKSSECCGLVNGYQDWGGHIPESCYCKSWNSDCVAILGSSNKVYKKPCINVLYGFMETGFNFILGISFGFAAVGFVVMALSMAMICQLKEESTFAMNELRSMA
nr:PREDICTED: tetraspanin-8-like [Lepisosteus oculatus]